MKARHLLLCVATAVLAPAYAETTADRWDLSEMYPSVAAWNADASKVDGELKELAGCKGHLGESAARFKQCLDLQADLTKRYYRLAAYSSEQASEDTGNAANQELDQKADLLGNRATEASAFVDPEILHIGKDRIAQFLKKDPSLSIYRFPLAQTLRKAPHTLNDQGEALIAKFGMMDNAFVTSNYAIFIAEIASTFNEELLLQRVLKTAKTDDERVYYLGYALEQLRGTFFRQAMFAEFERNIHARVDRGEPLTGEALTNTYCEILKRHHGAKEGMVDIDDAYCVEWAYIPHFYNSFYVYQYATSIAASALFAQRVGANEPGALPRYLDLLKAGGSGYPYDLVKKAGVDLATPAPYQALAARMNSIMDEIEAILAKQKK
jgi:oligoendopeptidase F